MESLFPKEKRKISEYMSAFLAAFFLGVRESRAEKENADCDLSLEARLFLQILGVFFSPLVSSASNVPEIPGREEYQEDDWPQVFLPFIFV